MHDFAPFLKANMGSELVQNRYGKVMKKQLGTRDLFFRSLEESKELRGSCPELAPLVLGLEGRGKGRGGSPNKERFGRIGTNG